MLSPLESWPPDYRQVFKSRQRHLLLLRSDKSRLKAAHHHYKRNPLDFIQDWCVTFDPRKAGTGHATLMPFILFKRQRELVEFLHLCLKGESPGLIEKSRDMGVTWLCAAFSVWLWLYWQGASIGWGSRNADLVDKLGDPDSIFEKMRITVRNLPIFFWPHGFDPAIHMTYMKLVNPALGSTITGDVGDNIGRGGRSLVYFKDESAHYVHPEMIEAALSGNTRVQIDVSSVNGIGNVFHRRREAGVDYAPGQGIEKEKTNVFVFDWRHHPAKTQEDYDLNRARKEAEGLLHIFKQEVDRDYGASVEGTVLLPEWIDAAVDAHVALGFAADGGWMAALDVADEGGDTNALSLRHGVVLTQLSEWGQRDTGETARRAIEICEGRGEVEIQYDCIGVGAGVKAESNRLKKESPTRLPVTLVPWNAGGEVLGPKLHVVPRDKNTALNEDFYQNLKAQGWWQLRRRFENTWRARHDPTYTDWKVDDLISLSSDIPLLYKLKKELGQPTVAKSARLKLMIDKTPDGTKSPNLADCVMMCYWPMPSKRPIPVSDEFLRRARMFNGQIPPMGRALRI
jgi:phage terminase large subunit